MSIQYGLRFFNTLCYWAVTLKKTEKAKRRPFSDNEKNAFLITAKEFGYKWFFLFNMYFLTGCRRAELPALRWQDIDFENECIYINHSIGRGAVKGDYCEYLGETKTKSSVRAIPLPKKTLFVLRMMYNQKKPALSSFVFKQDNINSKYKWLSLSAINEKFSQIRDKAGIDKALSIHCIRHTLASRLILAGVDITTIQAIGGWSSPKVLLEIYAHSNKSAVTKAMKSVIFAE